MLDRLIDLLISLWDALIPWDVVDEYERGVVLRLGKFHAELGPGFHWVYPFGIDRVLKDWAVTRTSKLPPQSLTTKDGYSIVIGVVTVYRVSSMRKFQTRVEGADQAIADSTLGVVSDVVHTLSWDELRRAKGLTDRIRESVAERALKFGIKIEDVLVSDLVLAPSHRRWLSLISQGQEVVDG